MSSEFIQKVILEVSKQIRLQLRQCPYAPYDYACCCKTCHDCPINPYENKEFLRRWK